MNQRGKRHVKELVRKYNVEVFLVLETHTHYNNVKSFWDRLGFSMVALFDAVGHLVVFGCWWLEIFIK